MVLLPPRPPGLLSGRSATLGAVPARQEGRELSHILSAWVSCSCARARRAGQKGKAEQQGQGCGVPRATVPRATVPAHRRTATAVHVCIQQRPRPGASVTQDPGGHPPHLPRRGTRQGFAQLLVLRARGCERAYVQPSPGHACSACAARRVGASPLSASTLHPTGGATHTQRINLAASERSTKQGAG